jgi:hypothetical protein
MHGIKTFILWICDATVMIGLCLYLARHRKEMQQKRHQELIHKLGAFDPDERRSKTLDRSSCPILSSLCEIAMFDNGADGPRRVRV